MHKTIQIEGMTCGHCSARVEKVLNMIDGVHATVNLEQKTAEVELDAEVSEEQLKETIENAGYEVVSVS